MNDKEIITAFNYFKILPMANLKVIETFKKRKAHDFLNSNYENYFFLIKNFIQNYTSINDLIPDEGDVELFQEKVDNFTIDSTVDVTLQQAVILFNKESYLFDLDTITSFEAKPFSNESLLAYSSHKNFLYSGGASDCALICAETVVNDCSIKLLAHVVAPNPEFLDNPKRNLIFIGEKLRLTVTSLIKQNKIVLHEPLNLNFKLFATTPTSLINFKKMGRVFTFQNVYVDFDCVMQNQESSKIEEYFMSILVSHEGIIIESDEELIYDSRHEVDRNNNNKYA